MRQDGLSIRYVQQWHIDATRPDQFRRDIIAEYLLVREAPDAGGLTFNEFLDKRAALRAQEPAKVEP